MKKLISFLLLSVFVIQTFGQSEPLTRANETYEIGITKGATHVTLYFSKDGNFVRSENVEVRDRRLK
jgi:hypothetical protein